MGPGGSVATWQYRETVCLWPQRSRVRDALRPPREERDRARLGGGVGAQGGQGHEGGIRFCLGRVVDKELHLSRSRERVLSRQHIETGEFGDPLCGYDEMPTPRKNARPKPKAFSVSFGDVWMPGRLLRSCGPVASVEAVCAISGPSPSLDTVYAP